MAMPLFDLEPQYASLVDLPLEALAVEDDKTSDLAEALVALQDEITPKVLALAKVVRTLEAEADLLENHARSLNAKAQTRRRRVDVIKRWVKLEMEAASIEKARDPLVTVWLQTSPPSVHVLNELAVPPEFQRAVLRLPYSLVPAELRGFLQHLDVERAAILDLTKRTGEVPAGVVIRTGEKHL